MLTDGSESVILLLVVQGLEVSMFKDFLITQTSSVTFGKRRLLVAKKINTG